MIERNFQIPFVSRLALAEKQIQQNYRPLIAVHKWFARRPGTLFRSLLLSELANARVDQTYFKNHSFSDKHILDPFMGGGTTVVEANRLGCAVTAADINPMAWWIVRQEIQDLDLDEYTNAAQQLREHLRSQIGHLYQTICPQTGEAVDIKYFIWVKTVACSSCGKDHDLFPNFLVARNTRHTANVFVCAYCNTLFETDDKTKPGLCPTCHQPPPLANTASRNRTRCLGCDSPISYPTKNPPRHRVFAIEYYRPKDVGAPRTKGRLFKAPDALDIERIAEAEVLLKKLRPKYIPSDKIPEGDETDRLHRWGYTYYRELFNSRQLLALELSCRWIAKQKNQAVREALSTNLSDLLRYQNMLCRYDTMALKSLDIFSVHGFPVGLIQCESNILGIDGTGSLPVGSGGWLNITEKFTKAKRYCRRPFEVKKDYGKKREVVIQGEWIGTSRNGSDPPESKYVNLICGDSTKLEASTQFDGVFTDPPYFGNVQYAELMDFCYVWLRQLVGGDHPEFERPTTRNTGELTGNARMGRDLAHFTEGISTTFRQTARKLKAGSPLAFTYHHNNLDAYVPLAVAILDAGLVCSASLPCPAEMGASIHINGTGSSIIDTVFVCRSTGMVPRHWVIDDASALAELLRSEVQELSEGGLKATKGDIRCIAHGHLTRLAIWNLRKTWRSDAPVQERMEEVRLWFRDFGGTDAAVEALGGCFNAASARQDWMIKGLLRETCETNDEIPF